MAHVSSLSLCGISFVKALVIDPNVGWSNNITGDISTLKLSERTFVNSVAAIESNPADINGAFADRRVPRRL